MAAIAALRSWFLVARDALGPFHLATRRMTGRRATRHFEVSTHDKATKPPNNALPRTLGAMRQLLLAAVLGIACSSLAASRLPADVQAFNAYREGCDHFRGEPWDPGDDPETKERREFIFKNICELCTGTDKKLASLRKKYRDVPTVIKHLSQYEDRIERH